MYARAWLLLLVCACTRGLLTAKEYICKDPDTGTLHSLNTTWPSTTFCGNYTCKLRKINTTTNRPASTIIVNLTAPQARVSDDNDGKSTRDINSKEDKGLSDILSKLTGDEDRLLNKEEIQKISELLHSVKKSDLEAVIDLYFVAQEIYKGINSDLTEKSRPSETELQNEIKTGNNKVSYWYDPENGYRKESDMKTAGSEYKETTYPARSQYQLPYFYAQKTSNYPSYFSGTLVNNNDFGRVGYYQPMANSQSLASYYQQRGIYDISSNTPPNPCSFCPRGYQYQAPLTTNKASGPSYAPSQGHTNMIRPYLPPFYNYSAQSYSNYNNYYKGNPWAYYDYYKTYPYPSTVQFQKSGVAINADVSTGQHQTRPADESKENSQKEDDKSWKTDPLSDTVINEIRANVAHGKLLNIPLKKRIKLERAARVIKLDQFKSRKTRSLSTDVNDKEEISNEAETQEKKKEENNSLEQEEVYETYIEKITCEPSSDPGYFRLGNMSQPYPDCCPQKIDKQR